MELIFSILKDRSVIWLIILNIFTGLTEIVTLITVVLFIEFILKGTLRFDFLNDAVSSFSVEPIVILGLVLISFALLNGGSRFVLIFFNARVSEKVGTRLSVNIMKRHVEQPYKEFITLSSSDLSNVSFAKVNFLVDNFVFPVFNLIATTIISTCIVVSITIMEPAVTIIMCLLVLLLYTSYFRFSAQKLKKISSQIPIQMDKAVSVSNDIHLRFRDLILQRSLGNRIGEFAEAIAAYRKSVAQYAVIATFPRYIFDTIGITIIALVAMYYAQVKNDETIFLILGTLLVSIQRLLPIAQQLFHSFVSIKSSSKVASEVVAALNLDAKRNTLNYDVEFDYLNAKSSIKEFSNLSISFEDDDGKHIVVGAGEILQIIGESGSGKSHFLLEALGLIQSTQRRFTVRSAHNSIEISEIYGSIEYLGQLVFLPQKSIADYLGLAEHNIPNEAVKYSNMQDFFAVNDVRSLKISEYGKNFSEGQKQRLAYLRAILNAPAILVLDEAFSNLDQDSREILVPNIRRCFPNTLVIYISHFDDEIDPDKKLIVQNRKVRLQHVGSEIE